MDGERAEQRVLKTLNPETSGEADLSTDDDTSGRFGGGAKARNYVLFLVSYTL